MNVEHDQTEFKAKSKPIDWKRIAIIALVLGIAGYTWYSENFGDGGGAAVAEKESENQRSDKDYQITFNEDAVKKSNGKSNDRSNFSSSNNSKTSGNQASKNQKSDEPYLVPTGRREDLKSPAGLIYLGGREHRRDHVLRHASDIPDRNQPHGVFHSDGDDVFRLIDEAYELVKKKSKQVKITPADDGKTEYVIDMKREVGYKGGKVGKRQNYPKLYKVKLILGDNRVITAYPY